MRRLLGRCALDCGSLLPLFGGGGPSRQLAGVLILNSEVKNLRLGVKTGGRLSSLACRFAGSSSALSKCADPIGAASCAYGESRQCKAAASYRTAMWMSGCQGFFRALARFPCEVWLFVSHLYRPVVEAVGTVGNSERFRRRVFQALWEPVGKSLSDFSTGSHRAAVSTAWVPMGGAA
jgi:hypothetical protein